MARTLVVVESAAKSRTIQQYLGNGYIVRACFGHVRDLPVDRMGVDVDRDFDLSTWCLRQADVVKRHLRWPK
jgi:DNA topoisomerase-1